ncbi:hypothetical protein NHJ6243_003632 [Beauveria neobassiana]
MATKDDDSISLTSTVEDEVDPDTQWTVKQILADGQVEGETKYLIEWEDFPLSACTWEPKEHLPESLLEEWAQNKQNQQERNASRLHIEEWRIAIIQLYRAKYARHEMRNCIRRRKKLRMARYPKSLEQLIAEINATPSDQPKATEDNTPAIINAAECVSVDTVASFPAGTPESVIAIATEPASQEADIFEARSRRSSIDNLFSDPDSDLEISAYSWHGDSADEEDEVVTTSESSTNSISIQRVRIQDTVMQDANQQLERPRQILAGIAIEPAVSISPENNPAVHLSSAETDLGSDAMDIDTSGSSPPATPLLTGMTAMPADTSLTETVLTKRDTQNSFEAKLAAEKPDAEQTTRTSILSTQGTSDPVMSTLPEHSTLPAQSPRPAQSPLLAPSPPPAQSILPALRPQPAQSLLSAQSAQSKNSMKRVSFSLPGPIQPKNVSKAEPSLFVPDNSHRQVTLPSTSFDTRSKGRDDISYGQLKTCVIGPTKLTCSFHVSTLPADSQMVFYREVLELEILNFSHVCTAQDLMQQLRATELSSGVWVTGTICSPLEADKLETIVDFLNASSFGLLCYSKEFCLVIYPSKSLDWQQSPLPTSQPPAGHLLQYLAFAPATSFQVDDLSLEFNVSYSFGVTIFDKQLYRKLLPSNEQMDKTRPIPDSLFLMFPPSAKAEEDLLCRWLRVSNRNCEIRSCAVSGHWARFIEGSRGAVILHQDCLRLLHRLPQLSKVLHRRHEDYKFWIFRLPLCPPISESLYEEEYMEQVGIALDWAFPPGVAVMAPPSFFISQPVQAYNLLKWIWHNFSAGASVYLRGKLVVAHNMDGWLMSLALEKKGAESIEISEVRSKTFMLMTKLVEEDPEDITSPVKYAPVRIDGNDEQSLVNWFGWWSTSQIDKFRKFSVICSDNDDDARLSRYINRSALRGLFSQAGGHVATSHAKRVSFKLVHDDTPQCLSTYIRSVSADAHAASWNPLVICPWAVNQHDGISQYGDASQWVDYFAQQYIRRLMEGTYGKKNTQVGFFYMSDKPLDKTAPVYPWLAFVRPMELHRKPWKHSELLFWDLRLKDAARRSQTIFMSDLSPAQRDLVTEVTEQYAKLKLPLGKIWVGGFKGSGMYADPLDITLDWMKVLVSRVKDWLPLSHADLLNRGWSAVHGSAPPGGAETGDDKAAKEPAQRILFPPPNGGSLNSQPYTNRLHQWAMAARVDKESQFTYVPTYEWYRKQQGSGRGFEHIRFWSWKAFFEHYKIDDPEK